MNGRARSSAAILREWDQASSSRRTQLLQWFLVRFQNGRDRDELDSECGADIALLLPRIVVWMDKTTQHHKPSTSAVGSSEIASPLDEQLSCVQLFLTTSTSHHYLRELILADGLRVLLRILETDAPPHHHGVCVRHRCLIYGVLARIIQCGRAYKELISQTSGELSMVRGAIATIEPSASFPVVNPQSRVWTLCRMTLLEQMVGNRACVHASYGAITFMLRHGFAVVRVFGAQLLRELINENSFFFDDHFRLATHRSLIPLSVELLGSTDVPLQHEALELVHLLLQKPATRKPICSLLAKWIHDAAIAADPNEPAFVAMRHTREYEMYIHLRSSFAAAAQSLTTLMHSIPRILPLLVQTHEVLIPMAFVLTVERPQSLKWLAALTAVHFVFERCRDVAANHLSQLFVVPVDHLMALPRHLPPDALVDELLRDDEHRQLVCVHFFENGWVRAMPPPLPPHPSQLVSDEPADHDAHDAALVAIEYEVDAAVHRIIPAASLYAANLSNDDDDHMPGELFLDFAAEKQFIETLERHFMKFRRFVPSSTSLAT